VNQQQKAEQTAYELLTELGADLHTTTPLQLCTAAVLRGVVLGLRDANVVVDKQLALLAREKLKAQAALRQLVERCDGDEGVRADGSNLDTLAAHAVLGDLAENRCADCAAPLPGPYGTVGVAIARTRPGVLLCSSCGTAEALARMRVCLLGFGKESK
jgi:hypothetical protein